MARILITNTYNLQNMGEVLQLTALVQQSPTDTFTMAGWYSFVDETVCRELGIRVAGNVIPPGKARLAVQALVALARTWIWREFGVPRLPPLLKAYADCDLVVDLGGDTFSDVPSPVYTGAHCFALLPALLLGKPYVICSQSIGPFKTPVTRVMAHYVLKHAAMTTARDPVTQHYLVHVLGLERTRVGLCRDLAFQLTPEAKSEPGLVGVNPSPLAHRYMRCTPDEYVRLMAEAVSTISRRYRVVLIPHVYGPQKGLGVTRNQDDREVIKAIRRLVEAEEGTHEDIARCSLFIGFRMHACISAMTRGIPTVVMAYGQKASGLPDTPWIRKVDIETAGAGDIVPALDRAVVSLAGAGRPLPRDLEVMRVESSCHISAIRAVSERAANGLLGSHVRCRVAAAADPEKRQSSASAGVTTTVVEAALRRRPGMSAVMLDTASSPPAPFRTRDPSEVARCTGSVYAFDDNMLAQMLKLAGECCDAVVVGLPCQVAALRSRYPEHLYIGLFCSHRVKLEGIRLLLSHFGLKGESIRYRAKVEGRSGMLVDGTFFIPLASYWNRFFNYAFIPDGCLRCRDLTAEAADISVGDAWTFDSASSSGLNAVITRTKRGEELIAHLIERGSIVATDASPADIERTQLNYLRLKKNKLSAKLHVYRALRWCGNALSGSSAFRPLSHLWLQVAVGGRYVSGVEGTTRNRAPTER